MILGRALTQEMSHAAAQIGAESVAFLCIGTDRVTGDALGPLVGDQLTRLRGGYEVIGTLAEPLHALNMDERVTPVLETPKQLVVAIDAALGRPSQVGHIHLSRASLRPGVGVGKKHLPGLGHLSVTATVNVEAGALSSSVLASTRLHLVSELARCIALACWQAARDHGRDPVVEIAAPAATHRVA